jgi:pimeloyl-ACP methyl ester carboxylesterase
MRGEFVDVGGARLYYYAAGTRGAGEPVVLVHGCLTSSHLWSCVVPCLPEGHRTVVVDLLGHGRSDPPNGQALSARAHADRLVQLLDVLCIERACLVGHGLGATIANLTAVYHSKRVSRLCLVNPSLWDRRVVSFLRSAPYTPAPVLMAVVRSRLRRGYINTEQANRSLDQYMRPFAIPGGHAVLTAQLTALANDDDRRGFNIIPDAAQTPTAIIVGENDPYASVDEARKAQTLNPEATIDVLPDAHYAPEESPERVAQVITQLLER